MPCSVAHDRIAGTVVSLRACAGAVAASRRCAAVAMRRASAAAAGCSAWAGAPSVMRATHTKVVGRGAVPIAETAVAESVTVLIASIDDYG